MSSVGRRERPSLPDCISAVQQDEMVVVETDGIEFQAYVTVMDWNPDPFAFRDGVREWGLRVGIELYDEDCDLGAVDHPVGEIETTWHHRDGWSDAVVSVAELPDEFDIDDFEDYGEYESEMVYEEVGEVVDVRRS
jgi:hypothetical protein